MLKVYLSTGHHLSDSVLNLYLAVVWMGILNCKIICHRKLKYISKHRNLKRHLHVCVCKCLEKWWVWLMALITEQGHLWRLPDRSSTAGTARDEWVWAVCFLYNTEGEKHKSCPSPKFLIGCLDSRFSTGVHSFWCCDSSLTDKWKRLCILLKKTRGKRQGKCQKKTWWNPFLTYDLGNDVVAMTSWRHRRWWRQHEWILPYSVTTAGQAFHSLVERARVDEQLTVAAALRRHTCTHARKHMHAHTHTHTHIQRFRFLCSKIQIFPQFHKTDTIIFAILHSRKWPLLFQLSNIIIPNVSYVSVFVLFQPTDTECIRITNIGKLDNSTTNLASESKIMSFTRPHRWQFIEWL